MPVVSWLAVSALLVPPDVGLRWDAPESCPPGAAIRDSIAQLTGADVHEGDAALEANATVLASEGRFTATVELTYGDSTRTREIAADDCVVLGRAVAVIVAVGLDPVTVATTLEAATATTEIGPPRTIPEPDPEPLPAARTPFEPRPSAPARRRRRPITLEYGGRVGGGVGGLILPGVGAGVSAAAFVGVKRLHVRAVAQYWPRRDDSLPGNDAAGARLQLVTGGLRVCPNLDVSRRWRFPLCAGIDGGRVIGRGRGNGLQDARDASSLWVAVILQPGVVFSITEHLGVWAAFEGAISINRPRFHLDGGGQLHEVGRFGPRGLVGLALQGRRSMR